jgi:hypothetical protein
MSSSFELSRNIDILIATGKINEALEELKKIPFKPLPLSEKVKMASYARRVGAPQMGIKWLFPLVYPSGRLNSDLPSALLLEYGADLIFAGAILEGRRLLDLVMDKEPLADMHYAFSYMQEWNYERAATHLKKFLIRFSGSQYMQIVARVNLFACLVRLIPSSEEAFTLSQDLLSQTKGKDYARVHSNTLELCVQMYLASYNFTKAREHLKLLQDRNPSPQSLDSYLCQKWTHVLEYLHSEGKDIAPLMELQKVAEQSQHSEILRDAHIRLALHNKDRVLFEHVFRGTPYASFQARARIDFKEKFRIPFTLNSEYDFIPEKQGFASCASSANFIVLDLAKGLVKTNEKWAEEFKANHLPLKLLDLLCRDFYVNKSLIELSALLDPKSYFHPVNSVQKIQQLISRINKSFESLNVKTSINSRNGFCSLRGTDLCLRQNSDIQQEPSLTVDSIILKVMMNSSQQYFSRSDIETASNVPGRTLARYLDAMVKDGKILVIGKGPNTRYFIDPAMNQAA